MRVYEFVFVVDPRLSEEEVVGLTDDYKQMISSRGARIVKEESWGKRKLAYEINKLTDGHYVLLQVETDGVNPLPEVEYRMRQNDAILRYLSVRIEGSAVDEPKAEGQDTASAAGEEA